MMIPRSVRATAVGLAFALVSACSPPAAVAPAPVVDTYGVDRARIEDLQARYLFALDFRDPDAYANTFTEDGVLDYGAGKMVGRKAINELVVGMRDRELEAQAKEKLRPAAGRHSITNIVINVDGDKATSVAYWHHVGNANADRKAQLNSFGHYEDELVKVNGEWLFSLRKIYNEQVAEWAWSNPGSPATAPGTGPKQRTPPSQTAPQT